MSAQQDHRIHQLLNEGVVAHGRGQADHALSCWRAVLAIDPGNQTAIGFLASYGEVPDAIQEAEVIPISSRLPAQDDEETSRDDFAAWPDPITEKQQQLSDLLATIMTKPPPDGAESETPDDTRSTAPPSDSATRSATVRPGDTFDNMFRAATLAYMRRDLDSAKTLFERCLQLRPNDSRVKFNLDRLKR